MLEKLLGNKYIPEKQWTSALREMNGIEPFIREDGGTGSAFTIHDPDGKFAQLVAKTYNGHDIGRVWGRRPKTWHLEVKASYGGLDDEFSLTWDQFERV